MKILIPDHIPHTDLEKVKAISPDVEIIRLKIVAKENIIRRVMRNITSRILPYGICKKIGWMCRPKKKYRLFTDGRRLNRPLEDVDVLLASWAVNEDVFNILMNYLPNLKWIHSMKTGFEYLNMDFIKAHHIIVTNARGIHSRRIAEFILACMFEVSKHISYHIDLKRRKKWEEIESVELEGKTVGILGTGSIGNEIAKKCRVLGMETIGCNRTIHINDNFIKIVKFDQMREVLEKSDFFVVCLPLTDGTKGLIGPDELSFMKDTAFMINIGRSRIIDESALIGALKRGAIAGAILDVYHHEMQLPNHPFYKLNNVILTHYSAHASGSSDRELLEAFLSNIKGYLEDKELSNVVSV